MDSPNGHDLFPNAWLMTVFPNSPQSLQLGNHVYKVTVGQDSNMFVQVGTAPEPSALALAASGLAGLGLRSWRRRRARRASQ